MSYDPEQCHRRSIRLTGYDYSQTGSYFVTVCTQHKRCLFGEVVDGEMRLNDVGLMVQRAWDELPNHYADIKLDTFIVMPNHVHGIIGLTTADGFVWAGLKHAPDILKGQYNGVVGAGLKPAQNVIQEHLNDDCIGENLWAGLKPAPTRRHGLSEIIRAFKTFSARKINEHRGTTGLPVWQRNYYEHIIRDNTEWDYIRKYIETNPVYWAEDKEYSNGKTKDQYE